MMNISVRQTNRALIGFLALALVVYLFSIMPVTFMDWMDAFRPAAVEWEAPFGSNIFNPPWLFALLHPLTWFDARIGISILIVVSLLIVGAYVKSPKKLLVVSLSAPLIALVTLGQIDGLIILGLMLPAELGLVWLMMKPQGVFLTALRRLSIRSMAIAGSLLLVSVLIWGSWWKNIFINTTLTGGGQNVSLFPYTILLGIPLIYVGLKRDSDAILCLASLCFSPYFMITSTLPAVASIIKETEDKRIWAVAILATWVYFFLTKFVI